MDAKTQSSTDLDEATQSKRIKISTRTNSEVEERSGKIVGQEIDNYGEPEIDENVKTNAPIVKEKSLSIEDMLLCGICGDIMYQCSSIQPCLHSFCGVCLLNWLRSGDDCPICRGRIEKVSKNHLLVNIINKYLDNNPDKLKPQDERDEADLILLNGKDQLYSKKQSTSDSNSPIESSLNSCPCCNYPNQHTSITHVTDLSGTPLAQFQCEHTTSHTQCHCCSIYIPLLSMTDLYPKEKCHLCNKMFCSIILGNCKNCTHGCLHTFKDFVFNTHLNSNTQVPVFLPQNYYETNVLRNYLNSRNMHVEDMYKECMDKMSHGELNLEQNVSGTEPLCLACSRQVVLDMVYEYFRSIPKSDLPPSVAARPDCYYGRHCRTQRTRQHHATNYNHACPQTRF